MKLFDNLQFRTSFLKEPTPAYLSCGHYPNGRLALQVFDIDDEHFLTLTTNLEEEECKENEVWIKISGENEGADTWLLSEDFIEPDILDSCPNAGALKYRLSSKMMAAIFEQLIEQGSRSRR